MATLYQRNGCYYINYSIHGRRVRKSVGSDLREAQFYLKELKYRLFKGDLKPPRPRIPVDYTINRYLKSCQARLAPLTHKRYRSAIQHFRSFITHGCPIQYIDQITKIMLSDYIDYRQHQTPRPKSNTINQELTIIRAMLNYALDNDFIDKNPASKIKMLKNNDTKKGRVIIQEEIQSLIGGCDGIKDGLWFKEVLIVFLNTGMRLGELLNLTWDDIDWEQMLIKIQEKPFWSPKSYERTIPVNQTVKSILEKSHSNSKSPFVFNNNNRKIEDNVLRKKLITLSRRVGLPHITRIHDFRHTFASNLLMAGVDIPTVQSLLGHRSWNTTIIYSHQTAEHTKKAVEKLVNAR